MADSQRKNTKALVIRTGCLACRALGIPCDTRNPKCKLFQSSDWETNQPPRLKIKNRHKKPIKSPSTLHSLQTGWLDSTHREQSSLYFFTTISAPDLAGYLDYPFWSSTLLQTTHMDPAIKHAVAAIGASHEYKLRVQAGKFNLETDGLRAFALRQVNKSIKALVRPRQGTREGLVRALTASVLFACWGSLSEGRGRAVPHVVHAGRILRQLKGMDGDGEGREEGEGVEYPISRGLIEPLVVQYESQLGVYYGDEGSGKEEYLDITAPINITSIAEARILLLQAISVTQDSVTSLGEDNTPQGKETLQTAKTGLVFFFHRWSLALDSHLSTTQPSPSTLRAAQLLQCHQLAAQIATSITPSSDPNINPWTAYTPQMKSILATLLHLHATDPRRTTPSSQPPQTPYFTSTMGMTEPLYIVASRCTDEETAVKARSLLGRLPPSEGAKSSWRVGFLERLLVTISGTGGRWEWRGGAEE